MARICRDNCARTRDSLIFMDPNESLLPKNVVMSRLGISDKTLRRLVKQGRLRVVKLGKTSPLKFRQLDVARLLESSTVSAS
jgi:excisionase family DNA binding protein